MFMNSIYALNESLLDDVEIEEVSDEDDSRKPAVGYRFSFNFVSSGMVTNIIKNMFFKRMMEPALERLKSGGHVDSWQFEKKMDSVFDDMVLNDFVSSTYYMKAKKTYKDTVTLSFFVFFNGSAFSEDVLGCTAATLFRAFMSSGIFKPERGVRMLMKRFENGNEVDEERCVFFEYGNLVFYAGTRKCVNDNKLCDLFAGRFVCNAARTGMIESVDDGNSRFVVLESGPSFGKMCKLRMLDASGNVLASYNASFESLETGKFLDNGLLRVKFFENAYNFMRMDGTLISDEMYGFCDDTFSDGYALVKNQKDKYNFVDCNGNTLSSEWFDVAKGFIDGIAVVWNVDKGETIIDTRGKRVIGDYYDDIDFEYDFINHKEASQWRIARVKNEFDGVTKCNYIDRSGKLLLNDWIEGGCERMQNGFAMLRDKASKTANYIREDGSIVSKKWFDEVCGWPEDGVFAYRTGDDWRFMDVERMKPLFGGEAFCNVAEEISKRDSKKYYIVKKEGRMTSIYGFISADGVKFADEMYEYISYLGNDLFSARHNAAQPVVVMRWGGEVVADNIKYCESVKDGYMKVTRVQKKENGFNYVYNFMDTDGNLVSKDAWFEYVGNMDKGFVIVNYRDENYGDEVYDVLTSNGVLLFGKGKVNKIKTVVPDDLVIVEKIEGNALLYNMFDASGKQMLDEWTDFCITPVKDGLVLAGPASYLDYSGKIAGFI